MKKILFLSIFFGGFIGIKAQQEYVPTQADLDHLLTTKTYVVLEESPMSDFNFEIKEVMEKLWGLTEYEFIKTDDFNRLSSNEDFSFLYTSLVSFEKDRTDSRYVFLHLSLGGPNLTMDDLRDIVSVPLGYFGVDPENYIYKLGTIVRFIQNHVNLLRKHPEYISINVFKHYNDNIQDLHQKTLYLIEEELSKEVGTAARIKQYYPYKFKIVSREDVREAIMQGDEDIVFLHKVGPEGKKQKARCYKILIGAEDAKFYYFDYHMVNDKHPDGFLESDFRKLAR